MKALTIAEMRDWEEGMKERGIEEEDLMELAGKGIAEAINKHFPQPGRLVMFLGKGHNAGDAFVAARHLQERGWFVEGRAMYPEIEWSVLTRRQHRLWQQMPQPREPWVGPTVIIDALLGIGARGMLREPIRQAVVEMVAMRQDRGAVVIALDVPTGLDADTGVQDDVVVEADMTFVIGAPKLGLLEAKAVNVVGRIELISLGMEQDDGGDQDHCLIAPAAGMAKLTPRPHDFHKGQAGRLSIVAGSEGMEGAAVLCANAALRVGAGLVTLWVPETALWGVLTRVSPEVMVRSFRTMREIDWSKADAFVMGPGCGQGLAEDFVHMADMVLRTDVPGVLDADALNAISANEGQHIFREHHVLTPHPGEFLRLSPQMEGMARDEMCRNFTNQHDAVLLLKGARTLIHRRGDAMYHNSTGHSGMATAGMGDVLSGVIGGLLAQGISPMNAACLGAWLSGRAAELAVPRGTHSLRSLIASDLLGQLGPAIAEWERA
ncbi:MAG: hypothetical protein RL117_826 [Verrucomicrobiota bacterium]|jgi:NAD(P)H-hydrate epimerase